MRLQGVGSNADEDTGVGRGRPCAKISDDRISNDRITDDWISDDWIRDDWISGHGCRERSTLRLDQ
jgi:hypothetical protein